MPGRTLVRESVDRLIPPGEIRLPCTGDSAGEMVAVPDFYYYQTVINEALLERAR